MHRQNLLLPVPPCVAPVLDLRQRRLIIVATLRAPRGAHVVLPRVLAWPRRRRRRTTHRRDRPAASTTRSQVAGIVVVAIGHGRLVVGAGAPSLVREPAAARDADEQQQAERDADADHQA